MSYFYTLLETIKWCQLNPLNLKYNRDSKDSIQELVLRINISISFTQFLEHISVRFIKFNDM